MDEFRHFAFVGADDNLDLVDLVYLYCVIFLVAMKRPGTGAFVAGAFGVVSLMSMASGGRLVPLRTVDVVQLIGTGMCFGAAIAGIVAMLQKRR